MLESLDRHLTDDAGAELWHPPYGLALDVAAVAQEVIRCKTRHTVGLDAGPASLRALSLWLVALRDIGKAAAGVPVPALMSSWLSRSPHLTKR